MESSLYPGNNHLAIAFRLRSKPEQHAQNDHDSKALMIEEIILKSKSLLPR